MIRQILTHNSYVALYLLGGEPASAATGSRVILMPPLFCSVWSIANGICRGAWG